jgi:hypothetical protein
MKAFDHFQRAIQVSKQRPKASDEAKTVFSLSIRLADGELVSLVGSFLYDMQIFVLVVQNFLKF